MLEIFKINSLNIETPTRVKKDKQTKVVCVFLCLAIVETTARILIQPIQSHRGCMVLVPLSENPNIFVNTCENV